MQYIRSFKRPREIISNRKAGWRTRIYFKDNTHIVLRNVTDIRIYKCGKIMIKSLFYNKKMSFLKNWLRYIAFHHEQKKEKGFLNV